MVKSRVSRKEAQIAVKTLIEWIGDDPEREGLKNTPNRVVKAYMELFAGYNMKEEEVINTFFEKINGYKEMVMLKKIPYISYCEHHIMPFYGHAHIAYIPKKKVVGLSKLPRAVDMYAKRLQSQEMLTQDIALCLMRRLDAKGVAVVMEGEHQCMCFRGVGKNGSVMTTSAFMGDFESVDKQDEFFRQLDLK